MSDADESTTGSDTPPKPALSRRDFLRRAGKEAVDTGTKLVPGAALTRKALGIDAPQADGSGGKSLMQRFAAWRSGRKNEDASESRDRRDHNDANE